MEDTYVLLIEYIIFVVMMYFLVWKSQKNCQCCLFNFAIIGVLFLIIFSFAVFIPYDQFLSQEFQPASNCSIDYVHLTNLDGRETYATLQIKFQNTSGKDERIGYGCASTLKQGSFFESPKPFKSYHYGEFLECGSGEGEKYERMDISELGSKFYNENHRFLLQLTDEQREEYEERSRKECIFVQEYQKIKIASWFCLDYEYFQKQAKNLENQPLLFDKCFYNIHGDPQIASENSKNYGGNVEDFADAYIISFDENLYYDKNSFLLLCALLFIPGLFFPHLSWIPYAANKIEPLIDKFQQTKHQVFPNSSSLSIQDNGSDRNLKTEQGKSPDDRDFKNDNMDITSIEQNIGPKIQTNNMDHSLNI